MKKERPQTSAKYKTLHSLSTTRWSSRVDNCRTLSSNIVGVAKTLDTIVSDNSYDRKTAGDATALLKSMDFEFCLILAIMSDLLELTQLVSKNLQSPSLNIAAASQQVQALLTEIESQRTDEKFEELWKKAEVMAESIGVEYQEKKSRKVSRRIDEAWRSEAGLSGKYKLKVSLHIEAIDLLVSAVRKRFGETVMPLLTSTDCLLSPSVEKLPLLEVLQGFYSSDIDARSVQIEYRLLCHALSLPDAADVEKNSIHSIFMFMLHKGMMELYPNVGLLYKLILTLPVTSCSNERSFSALKFVKNCLRTQMTQTRLSDLMVLSVQAKKLDSGELHTVRDAFWKRTDRR